MKSKIFYANQYLDIQDKIKTVLNAHDSFLSKPTAQSPRAVGDAIEKIICDSLEDILGETCTEYTAQFERRAMADLAFKDKDNFNYFVDVKTHRQETAFNMPNLTSVRRLAGFYEDEKNYFCIMLVKYSVEDINVKISDIIFVPIEFLDWECLTLGALGWGQIQIANTSHIKINRDQTRKDWMLQFCEKMLKFYPKEISKISKRVTFFQKVQDFWL
ncbi:MAG: hypothetical protein KAJ75_03060 [Alphaproteobacteria bacterium]|nr:hypothetical protein [Alphaproteobacteria bacterium]